jgi:hypothetical protein
MRAMRNPLTLQLLGKLPENLRYSYVYTCARVVDLDAGTDYVRVRFLMGDRPTELRESHEHFPSDKLVGQLLLLLAG